MRRANYQCPACDGRLRNVAATNAWRCRKCRQVVVETAQRVRRFYQRVRRGSR